MSHISTSSLPNTGLVSRHRWRRLFFLVFMLLGRPGTQQGRHDTRGITLFSWSLFLGFLLEKTFLKSEKGWYYSCPWWIHGTILYLPTFAIEINHSWRYAIVPWILWVGGWFLSKTSHFCFPRTSHCFGDTSWRWLKYPNLYNTFASRISLLLAYWHTNTYIACFINELLVRCGL